MNEMLDMARREEESNDGERGVTIDLLRLLHSRDSLDELMVDVGGLLQRWTGCEAVGIRVVQGDGSYPYVETRGYRADILNSDTGLSPERNSDGACWTEEGSMNLLEYWGSAIVRDDADSSRPYVTKRGSICVNELGTLQTGVDWPENVCNRCGEAGYESVAIIPVRHGTDTLGLLELESRAEAAFPEDKITLLERLAQNLAIGLDHRKTARKLAEKETQLETIVENAPMVMALLNSSGEIQLINSRGEQYVNESSEDLRGQLLCEAFRCEKTLESEISAPNVDACGHCPVCRAVTETIVEGKEIETDEVEFTFVRGDGEITRTMEGYTAPVQVENEGCALLVLHDVTEKRQVENDLTSSLEQLREMQEQVIDQERQKALSTMSSGIAHDFNNALTSIMAFAEVLTEDLQEIDGARGDLEYVELIKNCAADAADSVRRLKDFYRPWEGENQTPVDVNDVVEHCVSATQPRWCQQAEVNGKHIEVEKQLTTVPPVRGNELELHEMLTNLIFNSVEAIEEQGRIVIRTYAGDDEVILEVEDTGCGMTDEVLARCMEPFYTRNKDEGTGLGLSTTERVVNRHGGEMNIRSEDKRGTLVRIRFPAAGGEESDPIKGDSEARRQKQGKILLIEDKEEQREALADLLSARGYSVTTMPDGGQGIREFQEGEYNAVVLDRAMPGMNGDECAREIKGVAPSVPVLMLSGFGDLMEAKGDIPECVDLLLSKPTTGDELGEAVARLIEGEEQS